MYIPCVYKMIVSLMYLFCTVDSCTNIKCSNGSQCRVFKPTGEAYCEPSCDINNGGCPANEKCSLQPVQCIRAPCPPVVQCSSSINVSLLSTYIIL